MILLMQIFGVTAYKVIECCNEMFLAVFIIKAKLFVYVDLSKTSPKFHALRIKALIG